MTDNRFRQLIESERVVFGIAVFIPSVVMVDIVAEAGYDYVMLWPQYAPYDIKLLTDMVRTAEGRGLPTVVKMENPDPYMIPWVLDAGADCIMVTCSSKQEAQEMVKMTKVPPMGIRRLHNRTRAANYNIMVDFEEYGRRANEVVFAVVIETKEGFEHAEEILSVPGIDAVWATRGMLAFALGLKGRHSPELVEAQQHVMALAKSAGIIYCQGGARTPEVVREWLQRDKNIRIFTQSADIDLIRAGLHTLLQGSREVAAQFVKG
ncbi:HpcH/HpaI aldolase/citrate lyase family protein [Chloroflexota bacterium]